MNIKFTNGKIFEYINAIAIERDFKNGYTRPSIEISMPIAQTSYEEIEGILSSELIQSFTLIGDEMKDGNEIIMPAPQNTYTDYTILGKITIEDGVISFKLYKLSDTEIENKQAKQAIDELLIAMEA